MKKVFVYTVKDLLEIAFEEQLKECSKKSTCARMGPVKLAGAQVDFSAGRIYGAG